MTIDKFFAKHGIVADRIIYMTKENHASVIHLVDGRTVKTTNIPLKSFYNALNPDEFYLINRAVAVAERYIDHIDGIDYYMRDGSVQQGNVSDMTVHNRRARELRDKIWAAG